MVRAPASGVVSSNLALYIFHRIKLFIFFYFLVFPDYFSQFWSKTICEDILKVRQYHICNGKEAKVFYFSKWQIPHIRAKRDTKRGYQAFYSRYNAFIEIKKDLVPDNKCYIRRKSNILCFCNILKNDNSNWFWYTSSFTRKSSSVLYYY